MAKQAPDITAQDKADFLEELRNGDDTRGAAEKIGTTASTMRKFWSGKSAEWYDPEFGQAVQEVRADQAEARKERLDNAYWKLVDKGHWPAIEKGLYAYHDDFEALRHTNLKVSGTVDHKHILERVVSMSDAELDAALEEAEKNKAIEARAVQLLPPADAA